MFSFNIKSKKGYFAPQEKIVIFREGCKIPFYMFDYSNRVNKFKRHFNLPKGTYTTENNIKKAPIKKQHINKLPKKEAHRNNAKKFQLIFAPNPNKATVNFTKKIIILDNKYKHGSFTNIVFILAHEFGHRYYTTEKYADLYAQNYMLKMGFNNSQIMEAIENILTMESSDYRKNYIYKKLKKL